MTHRPACWIALAFTGGIAAFNVLGEAVLFGFVVVLAFWLLIGRRYRTSLALAFVFMAGAFAAWNAELLPLNHIARRLDDFRGRECSVACRVESAVRARSGGLAPARIFLCDIREIQGEAWQGRVMVHLYGPGEIVYGNQVSLRGKIARPYDFSPDRKSSYVQFLRRQGVHAILHVKKSSPLRVLGRGASCGVNEAAHGLRERLQGVFRKFLSPGEAGLMNAMLLGPRNDIPAHVYDVFRKTGTAHIIAISGMNMTLTAAGLMILLGMFNIARLPRACLAVLMLGFYALMAGNSAPVARSAIMAGVVILSFVLERETDPLNSLALAGIVLLAADPGQLHDVGFQLSFLCVASLIVLTPLLLAPFQAWRCRPLAWFFLESAMVTLAAFIGSAGLLAHDFGYLAPVGLLVNLPVIPLMALITSLGFLVLCFGLLAPFMAMPFALCLKVALNIGVGALTAASHVPAIHVNAVAAWEMPAYYAVLAGTCFFFYYRRAGNGIPDVRAFIDKPLPL